MNAQPTSGPSARSKPVAPRESSAVNTSAIATRPAAKRAAPLARKLRLGDEPAGSAALDERAEVGAVATRGQDDHGRILAVHEPGGNVESVGVGQLDVEQDQIWPQ